MTRLKDAIYNLLSTHPFYAHFVLNSRILWDKYNVPTAGATVINFVPTLVFNTEFVEKLTNKEFVSIIEHEVDHLLHGHHNKMGENKHIKNIAMDCAINQYIKNLPKDAITPEFLEKLLGIQVLKLQDSEYYYNLLIQQKEKLQETFPLDVHEIEGLPKPSEMELTAGVKGTTKKAVKAAAGNIPQHLQSIIAKLNEQEKISWKQVLKNFISSSVSVTNIGTRKKSHRRFDLDAPGKRKKRELVVGVCVDSSGSVSDVLFSNFLNEINHICKNVATVHFIDADCEVQNVQTVKKGNKIKFERTGGGGTAYQPAISKAKELKSNLIIYMGDGDCADVPEAPGVPFLWVFPNENIKRPGEFGKVLVINE